MDKINLGIAKQSFTSVVWTHKIHEKCAEILDKKNNKFKKWNIILVSLVLVFTILQVKYSQIEIIGIISISLTLSEFILLIITLTYNYGELAEKHKQFAKSFLSIREDYLSLIGDIINGNSLDVDFRRNNLKDKLEINNRYAPNQVDGAYDLVVISLGINPNTQTGDYTYSDDEIDRFLPLELKSTSYNS
ncbi:MAG: SLATT domain-containing protein [Candidatus Gracilibacteria bacterium]|nr:SLATT domain-containing protein [Candidatus Gracilibacteria bacterium]MDD4530770.1 SLATT domain-containing protein [Candidatus Gracilibacteria bacterium]